MRYVYISAWLVEAGFQLAKEERAVRFQLDNQSSFTLTRDPDPLLMDIDRKTAVCNLILEACFKGARVEDLQDAIGKQIEIIRSGRKKRIGQSPVLVFEASGDVEVSIHKPLEQCNDFSITFDAYDAKKVIDSHRQSIDAFMVASILSCSDVPRFAFLDQGTYLKDESGRVVYSLTCEARGTLSFCQVITKEAIADILRSFAALRADSSLRNALRLYAQATASQQDDLRAFLFGWTALEVFIGKAYKNQKTQRGKGKEQQQPAVRWGVSLMDKFQVITEALWEPARSPNRDAHREIIESFKKVKNSREAFVHEQRLAEADLPVGATLKLLKDLLLAHAKQR
jgi:hypothetical protein